MTKLTGLSARVIRVWFQNKRCKDKKKAIAAASGDDMISSSVADSPSDDMNKNQNSMESLMDKEFGGLDCSQIDFNNSSTSTSPALSSTGETYSIYEAHKDVRNMWAAGDFIPTYSQEDSITGDLSGGFDEK